MKNWFIVSLLSLLALVSCTNFVDEGAGLGGVKASVSQLSFSYSLSVQNFSVTSGEKWTVQQIPDWLRVSQISGRGYMWSVSLTSVENYGYDRSGVVTLHSSSSSAKIDVSQQGRLGAYVPVSSVSLSPQDLVITEGETRQLTATVYPSNASVKNVRWGTSSASVATVSSSGVVTAVSEGSATITVTTEDGSKTATCQVTVKRRVINVTGVSLNKTYITLTKGETSQLTATVSPSNATNKNVNWKSSSTSVATVSSSGLVTAVGGGTATITVTTEDVNYTATCKVTVKIPVTGVKLDQSELSLTEGETRQLTATVSPSDATNKTVSWKSSSAAVATVSTSGLITAKAEGSATITVTTEDGSKTATCRVTVKKKVISVTGVSVSPTSLTLTEGDTYQLATTVSPSNATNKNVSWKSSSTSIATVSSSGLITAKAEGSATITVTTEDGNKTATCSVTVKKKVISVTGVSVSPTSLTLTEGDTYQLATTVFPSNATNKTVSWKSSSTAVATISASGLVTAKAEGSATITVTTEDGSKTAMCRVTVNKKVISVTSVSVSPTSLLLTEGDTYQLAASVSPSNATNKTVSWKSSSIVVATVSTSGLITAKAEGSATITVTTEDGSYTATCRVTVKKKVISVTGVSVSPTSVTLTEGDTYQLAATVFPSNATNKNVRWQSNSTGVATVSSTGLITSKAEGSATITVTTEDGSYTATCRVTVNKKVISVTGVSVSPTSLTLTEGDTYQLAATVSPSNATNKNVRWQSNSTGVATVSSTGLIIAKVEGSATITVTTEDSGYTASCYVTVRKRTIPVTGVSVSPTSVTLTEGNTYQLSATVSPSNATNKTVRWTSNATSVATVSSSGLITAIAQGSVTITVTTEDGGYTATCRVTVNKKTISVTGVSLNATSVTLNQGGTYQLTATVYPSNATNKNVSWTSSSTSVAVVSASGLVTAKQAGTATITVTAADGGYAAYCSVTVSNSTTGYENGHAWVDLGLPSGLKWATCNVGASSSSDYGNYYAWGEISTKSNYEWSTYRYCNGTEYSLTKYNTNSNYGTVDNRTRLEMSDDAARANWGGSWRMPTGEEFGELGKNCIWTWTTQDGKYGYKVTSKTNGNSIFLPATGYRYGNTLHRDSMWGYYWSSSLYNVVNETGNAFSLEIEHTYHLTTRNARYIGCPVRPVTE